MSRKKKRPATGRIRPRRDTAEAVPAGGNEPARLPWKLIFLAISLAAIYAAVRCFPSFNSVSLDSNRVELDRGDLPELPSATLPTQDLSSPEIARIFTLRKEAVETLRTLLEQCPDDPRAIAVLAQTHYRFGDSDAALACWRRCLALDAGSLEAYSKMAYIETERGNYPEAERHLRTLVERAPQSAYARVDLAEVLTKQGKFTEAVEVLQTSLEIELQSAAAHVLLGLIHLQNRANQDAFESFTVASEIAPDYPNTYHGLATVCARLGMQEQADVHRQRYDRLREETQTEDPGGYARDLGSMQEALCNVCAAAGNVYMAHGRNDLAEQAWRRAAEVLPADLESRNSLVSLHVQAGELEAALPWLDELYEIDPENVEYRQLRDQIRQRLGLEQRQR